MPRSEPEFHGSFDGDERRFDDECVVAGILKCFGAGEQAICLPQLEEGGILDIEPGFDVRRAVVEGGLRVVDELLDLRLLIGDRDGVSLWRLSN